MILGDLPALQIRHITLTSNKSFQILSLRIALVSKIAENPKIPKIFESRSFSSNIPFDQKRAPKKRKFLKKFSTCSAVFDKKSVR